MSTTNPFLNICQMSQKALKFYVANRLRETHNDITNGDGFVYAQGTFPVLLVAHLDTVHEALPDDIYYNKDLDAIFSPTGIGGDDRCGVYMIFEIIKRFNCSVLFCEDEEVGGLGAKKFIKTDLAKQLEFNYIIEFDRRGSNDAVFYDCDNDEFETFITKEFYKTAYGSFSDISTIAPFLKCAAVNLSCGYYKAHTTDEYVVLSEMAESIEAACRILERTTADDKFEYIESQFSYENWQKYLDARYGKGYGYYGSEDYYYGWGYDSYGSGSASNFRSNNTPPAESGSNYYFLIEFLNEKGVIDWGEVYANSRAEAIGKFLMDNPDMTYNDITDICYEDAASTNELATIDELKSI